VAKNIPAGGIGASGSVSGLWTSTDVTQPLTRALADSLIAGKTYINFHTSANPGGEMRGQVKFGSDVVTEIRRESEASPSSFKLEQNYPNPFNPETVIPFAVSERSFISLKVFNILGQEVQTLVNTSLSPGSYSVKFNGARMGSGVYFYRMTSGSRFNELKKMMFIK